MSEKQQEKRKDQAVDVTIKAKQKEKQSDRGKVDIRKALQGEREDKHTKFKCEYVVVYVVSSL